MRLLSPAAAVGLLAAAVLPVCSGLRTWQPIRELRKQVEDGQAGSAAAAALEAQYPAHTLRVPVDHFPDDPLYAPHVNDTFALRYWFDAAHYRAGGPVILLAAGETSGTDRLVFLQKGIAAQLARATGGLAVVLEHRYYGASVPYANLSTESLRFLRTEQALADTAYFARHVRFPGVGVDVSPGPPAPPGTGAAGTAPWIVYGGSYAGAFAAFLRIRYPDLFWGAISSSGVTVAIHDYWQYYEAQRRYAPPACVRLTQQLIHAADQILLAGRRAKTTPPPSPEADGQSPLGQTEREAAAAAAAAAATAATAAAAVARVAQLKAVFGLGNVTHDDDFAAVLSDAMGGWQDTNWDPAENSPGFAWYCGNVTAAALLYPELATRRARVRDLLAATTYAGPQADALALPMLNYIGWVQRTHPCPEGEGGEAGSRGRTQDQCFGNHNATFYRQDDLAQRWRPWAYQYCTQWGYLATGSGVPADRLPLVSRLLDLAYLSTVCRDAFRVAAPPDVASVNRYGAYDIAYPRLAIVDGEADPWRAATPHAIGHHGHHGHHGHRRPSTASQPFLLIRGGAVHHWDEYGLWDNETTPDLPPPPVRRVQADEAAFVAQWVADWAAGGGGHVG